MRLCGAAKKKSSSSRQDDGGGVRCGLGTNGLSEITGKETEEEDPLS